MLVPLLRQILSPLRHTPFHPQWLLCDSRRMVRSGLSGLTGQILDIGCADRWVASALGPGCDYVGLDYPATGRDLYRARPNVFADASSLPFGDGNFDAVIMLEVVEHLRLPEHAFREAVRVMKPGGKLLLSMPFLYPIHDAPFDFQRYTTHGLEREVRQSGLQLQRIERVGRGLDTAGLLVCLALSGSLIEAWRLRSFRIVWAPLVVLAIPLINLFAACAARLLPDWNAICQGYWLVAEKPRVEA